MSRHRKEYPGITKDVSRHGKVCWRFRMKGKPGGRIYHPYGSAEFKAAYQALMNGTKQVERSKTYQRGSFDHLIVRFRMSAQWSQLSTSRKYVLGKQLDRFSIAHGHRMVSELKGHHIEALMARKSNTPSAANELRKLIMQLCNFAIRQEWISHNPASQVEKFKENPDGFHTWTDAEVKQFENFHGVASKPVLAMRLVLWTGASRQDVAKLGWQNIKNDRFEYKRGKTGQEVSIRLSLMPELLEVLHYVSRDDLLFITHSGGRGYTRESFGNWFKTCCREANLSEKCQSHGLRKAGATKIAEAGGTELEIAAHLGHETTNEARTYVRKFNRQKSADAAMKS